MTVEELINLLKQYPGDYFVQINDENGEVHDFITDCDSFMHPQTVMLHTTPEQTA